MRNIKRWSKEENQRLKSLYFNKKFSILKICKILSRTPASVNQKLSSKFKRNRSLSKIKIPCKITPALARVHAHVCGDGNLFQRREKDSYGYMALYKPNSYRFRFGIQYTNFNQRLINEFTGDSKSTFGLKPYFRDNRVTVKSRDVWRLMKELGAGKSREWFISPRIMKVSREIKKNWIKAFFDDEACFNANGAIRVRFVNRKGITQLKKMLNEFVPSHITPKNDYYPDHSVYLNINKRDAGKYFSKIGSLRYQNKIN
ncbi:MAG: hypothetical protein Q7K98_01565 [Candidatus Omnitrophota bacterium]|nr:hypothetical protein [Candidatus Omnitrophota bacterium]